MANEFLDETKIIGLTKTGKTVAEIQPPSVPKLSTPLFGYGRADQPGVEGDSAWKGQPGVLGANGDGGDGVLGVSNTGIGVHGRGGQLAGLFEGDIHVTGNVHVEATLTCVEDIVLPGADCAEDFDVAGDATVDPGTVMVLSHYGALSESREAYDRRVAGVISGAGDYRPGIVLDKRQAPGNRQPIALLGKVFCKVDAQFGAIEVGDMLTTSPTPGHAMRTGDPLKAFGAVIGKALRPLPDGRGLIPILIARQ